MKILFKGWSPFNFFRQNKKTKNGKFPLLFYQLCVSSRVKVESIWAGSKRERERKKGIIAITYFIRVAQSSAYGWELTMGMFCKNVFMMKSNCGSNWTCLPANIITAGLFQRIYTPRRLRTFSCQYFSYCASLRDALSYKHMTPRHNLPIVVHLIYVFLLHMTCTYILWVCTSWNVDISASLISSLLISTYHIHSQLWT